MAYKVIEIFADLQDDGRVYHPGDTFPREGVIVRQKRLDELASAENKIGKPLIAEDEPAEPEKKVKKPKKK